MSSDIYVTICLYVYIGVKNCLSRKSRKGDELLQQSSSSKFVQIKRNNEIVELETRHISDKFIPVIPVLHIVVPAAPNKP